jgi:hypothetical protein
MSAGGEAGLPVSSMMSSSSGGGWTSRIELAAVAAELHRLHDHGDRRADRRRGEERGEVVGVEPDGADPDEMGSGNGSHGIGSCRYVAIAPGKGSGALAANSLAAPSSLLTRSDGLGS